MLLSNSLSRREFFTFDSAHVLFFLIDYESFAVILLDDRKEKNCTRNLKNTAKLGFTAAGPPHLKLKKKQELQLGNNY